MFVMTEFENKLILGEEPYHNGFFPQIPNFRKTGSAFILTGGSGDDILVTERTTGREIRQNRYTRLVEVSTLPYMKEIRFTSSGKEQAYSFDVYVKAVIQVVDPITLYHNKNVDVDAYFDKLFSIDVKQITRRYSILDFDGLDRELTQKLSAYNNVDVATGFSYQVSKVDAEPSERAKEYVRRASEQQLEAALRNQAFNLAEGITADYGKALMAEVAEGKLTMTEAILKKEAYDKERFDTRISQADQLVGKGYLAEHQAQAFVLSQQKTVEQKQLEPTQGEDPDLNQFFSGE